MQIKELLPGVKKNIPLAEYTTFRIGGRAKYFFTAKTKDEIVKAVEAAKQVGLPFFILGGGSNILFPDKGFAGLIIEIRNSEFKIRNSNIYAETGIRLSEMVSLALNNGLGGLEWAAGIPGTIGGAIRGNAGAFGFSMANVTEEVEVFNVSERRVENYKREDCGFGYRESIFKHNRNLIALSASMHLFKEDKEKIKEKMEDYREYKREHHPLNFPSAGSVFKGVPYNIFEEKVIEQFPKIMQFQERKMVPAGFLIEKSGLKGRKIGRAQISEKHSNFIINLGQAKAGDVLSLIELAKKEVREIFGVGLEEEIMIVKE